MVLYTGTHDNLPIQGWLDLQSADTKATIAETLKTKGIVCEDLAWGMVELANASIADIVIVPVQDILGIRCEARINTPGTVGSQTGNGNWKIFLHFMKNWSFVQSLGEYWKEVRHMKEIYQIRKRSSEVYQIMEAGLGAMYVICEEKQAVLVDTGTGISNLNACVRNSDGNAF